MTGAAEATNQHNEHQTAKSIVCRFIHLLPRMHAFDALQSQILHSLLLCTFVHFLVDPDFA